MTAVLREWVNLDLRHRHWRRPCEREDGCLPAKERGLNRSPLKLSGGTSPANTLISGFQTPEWRDDKYLLLKPPHRGCSVTAARANEYLPRAIAESWGHISSRGYLGIRLLQADCHLPRQRNYGQSKRVGGAHIKLPGAVLEGQQAPEDMRSRPRSTQPQIPPSGPARTTLGAPNPFSCPLGEAGPLPGIGLSPTPERALLTLHPQTSPPGSHGDALQPSPSDTGDAGPLGTRQPACLRGSAVWKERDRAGDRPGPTGLGKVARARERGSQCPLAPGWTQTGGVATPSSSLLGAGTMLPNLSLFAKVLGKCRLLPKLPGTCSRRAARVARGPWQLYVGPCWVHQSTSSSLARLVSTREVPGADSLAARPPGLADN